MSDQPLRLCLVGADVGGSPTPAMFAAAFAAWGIDGSYEALSLPPHRLDSFIAELRQGRWRGCNVTLPFKPILATTCDALEGDALRIQVVNTIVVSERRLTGHTTDATGFQRALAPQAPAPAGVAVLLGAGGAAAAVALALLRGGWSELHIVARRVEQARSVATRLDADRVQVHEWHATEVSACLHRAHLVVNATPAGLAGTPLDLAQLQPSCLVTDLRYRPHPLDVVALAQQHGLQAWDGREMLLQQAMLSFELWTRRAAPEHEMRRALGQALAS